MLKEYFYSIKLNALFNRYELVTQMVKTLWNIVYNTKIYSFAILLFKNIEQDAESKRKP
jgi:hypothetical protein